MSVARRRSFKALQPVGGDLGAAPAGIGLPGCITGLGLHDVQLHAFDRCAVGGAYQARCAAQVAFTEGGHVGAQTGRAIPVMPVGLDCQRARPADFDLTPRQLQISAARGDEGDFVLCHADQLAARRTQLDVFGRIDLGIVVLALQQQLAVVGNGLDAALVGKQRCAFAGVDDVIAACGLLVVLLRHAVDVDTGVAHHGLGCRHGDAGRGAQAEGGCGAALNVGAELGLRRVVRRAGLMLGRVLPQALEQTETILQQGVVLIGTELRLAGFEALPGGNQQGFAAANGTGLVGSNFKPFAARLRPSLGHGRAQRAGIELGGRMVGAELHADVGVGVVEAQLLLPKETQVPDKASS